MLLLLLLLFVFCLSVDAQTISTSGFLYYNTSCGYATTIPSPQSGTQPHNCVFAPNINRVGLESTVTPIYGWNTIGSYSGSSGILRLIEIIQNSATGDQMYNSRLRITFDGASIPQIGGINGIQIEGFVGPGNGCVGGVQEYRTNIFGTQCPGAGVITFWFDWIMPFYSSFLIEFDTAVSNSVRIWRNIEYSTQGTNTSRIWTMHGIQHPQPGGYGSAYPPIQIVPDLTQVTFMSSVGQAARLWGGWHRAQTVSCSSGYQNGWIEGDYVFYVDGQIAGWATGTEDYYHSSFTFQSFNPSNVAATVRDNVGFTKNGGSSTNYEISAYRFYPLEQGGAYTSRNNLTVTWFVGDPTPLLGGPSWGTPGGSMGTGCTAGVFSAYFWYELN